MAGAGGGRLGGPPHPEHQRHQGGGQADEVDGRGEGGQRREHGDRRGPGPMATRSAVVLVPAAGAHEVGEADPDEPDGQPAHAQAPQQVLGGEDRADAVGAHALRHGRGADALERGQLALGGVRIHEPPQQSDRTLRQRANQMVPTEQGRVDGIRVGAARPVASGRRGRAERAPVPGGRRCAGAGWRPGRRPARPPRSRPGRPTTPGRPRCRARRRAAAPDRGRCRPARRPRAAAPGAPAGRPRSPRRGSS